MRWSVWGETRQVQPAIFDETMTLVARALGTSPRASAMSARTYTR